MGYPPPGEPPDPQGSQQPYGEQPSGGQYGQPTHYGQPSGYSAPPGYGQPSSRTNVLAILSLVFAFVFAPVGIVLGHVARRQIRQTGEQGGQLATWGMILGYVFTAIYLIGCCAWLGLAIWVSSEGDGGTP